MKNKILIVVLNWNKREYLIRALKSIHEQKHSAYDCLVVDNGSDENPESAIRSQFPEVFFLRNSINLGGAGGFNSGLMFGKKNNYDYVWLLDEDVEVAPDALQFLLATASENPDAYLIGSKVYIHGTRVIQECGGMIGWKSASVTPNKRGVVDDGCCSDVLEVDYAPACSLLVNLMYADRVGFLAEKFFVLWDDMEWGARAKSHGFKVLVNENSVIWHHSGGANKQQLWRRYYFVRNRQHFFSEYISFKAQHRVFLFALRLEVQLALLLQKWSGFSAAFAVGKLALADAKAGRMGECRATLVDANLMADPIFKSVYSDGLPEGFVFLRFGGQRQISGVTDWSSIKGVVEKVSFIWKALIGEVQVIGYRPHVLLAAAKSRYLLDGDDLYRMHSGGVASLIGYVSVTYLVKILLRIKRFFY